MSDFSEKLRIYTQMLDEIGLKHGSVSKDTEQLSASEAGANTTENSQEGGEKTPGVHDDAKGKGS